MSLAPAKMLARHQSEEKSKGGRVRSKIIGEYRVIEGGALTTVAEGGEDLRGLILAVSWLLWPNGLDTWLPQGGFSCSLEQMTDDSVALTLETVPLSGKDDLPAAALALVIDMALHGAACFEPRELTVDTRAPDASERIEWSQLNWARNLARGSTARGAIRVDLQHPAGEELSPESQFWRSVEEQLHVPDVPFRVRPDQSRRSAQIEEIEPSLFNLARVIDAVRSASAAMCPAQPIEISARRVR